MRALSVTIIAVSEAEGALHYIFINIQVIKFTVALWVISFLLLLI